MPIRCVIENGIFSFLWVWGTYSSFKVLIFSKNDVCLELTTITFEWGRGGAYVRTEFFTIVFVWSNSLGQITARASLNKKNQNVLIIIIILKNILLYNIIPIQINKQK